MKLEWDNKALSLECGHPKVADQEQFVSNNLNTLISLVQPAQQKTKHLAWYCR
ncbi:hypothetical protein [uncultured Gammaproteobacteria bacterium]|nr:hypothetical protein [uncultured Gammaproteobacteria bacterium]